jgi:sugar phosphate permease
MTDTGRGKLFYGWYIVAACFVVNFIVFGISVNTFTVYVKPIEAEMGWSRKAISAAMSLAPVAMGIASPFVGRLIDRIGARFVMAAGALIVGVGSLLLAKTQSLPYFYAVYTVAGVGQAGATLIPISLVISNWFEVKRGRALGVVMTGTGLGAMVMVPVTTWIVVTWGWRTSFLVMGWIILTMVPLNLLLIRTRPSEIGLLPDGGAMSEDKPRTITGLRVPEAVRTSSFWLIGAMMLITGLVAMGIGIHQMAYLQDIGHSPATAATIIAIVSGLTVFGKLGLGVVADWLGLRTTVVAAFSVIIAGILLLMRADAFAVACVYAIVYGFAIGSPLLINPALTAQCLGLAHFGAVFGLLTVMTVVGAAMGAFLTGAIYDSAKSYMPAFWLFIGLMVIATICGMRARREIAESKT